MGKKSHLINLRQSDFHFEFLSCCKSWINAVFTCIFTLYVGPAGPERGGAVVRAGAEAGAARYPVRVGAGRGQQAEHGPPAAGRTQPARLVRCQAEGPHIAAGEQAGQMRPAKEIKPQIKTSDGCDDRNKIEKKLKIQA